MKVSSAGLIHWAQLSAVLAGLLFVAIQVVHPADTLAAVARSEWVIVHSVSVTMTLLFVIGLVGIYARQMEAVGAIGLAGLIVLTVGLLLTAFLGFVELAVAPQLVSSNPAYVEGLLGLVTGHPSSVDLGALPALWSASSAFFLLGTLAFGVATLWAGVLPRVAAALFAFGLLLAAPAVAAIGSPRLAAVPIGLGLAWLGYAAWSKRRESSPGSVLPAGPSPADQAARA